MKVKRIHCLFEQSGSFKNTFKSLGYEAYDYDIQNDFNETDYVIDLFNEIENAYVRKPSIFDNMNKDDLVISFFPCTYFSIQNELIFSRKLKAFQVWSEEKIDAYIKKRYTDRAYMFSLLLKYVTVCKNRNIKMMFENPYSGSYLLTKKQIKNPDIVIQNRTLLGDNHIKPTGFWFYNFEPTYFTNYLKLNNEKTLIHNNLPKGPLRSHIHKDFAFNFINKFILGVA